MDWFLYDRDLRYDKVSHWKNMYLVTSDLSTFINIARIKLAFVGNKPLF